MNQWNDEKVRAELRAAFPPVAVTEPRRDLWPLMLRRMEATPQRIHWFDWAVAALSALLFLLLPGAAPILLYFL